MKSYFFTFILMVQFLALTFTASFAQINWTKDASNPVWGPGVLGELISPFVYIEGTTYNMWYGDYDGTNIRIELATSTDGINWTEPTNNLVLDPGPNGSWDDEFVFFPTVILNNTTFHMWYDGNDGSFDRVGHAIIKSLPGHAQVGGTH